MRLGEIARQGRHCSADRGGGPHSLFLCFLTPDNLIMMNEIGEEGGGESPQPRQAVNLVIH